MITAILPAYKSKSQIASVLKAIPNSVSRIIVVDDACPQQTGDYVFKHCADKRITVIYHKENQGVGGAMISGYTEALKTSENIFVKIDSDGQMNPNEIPRLTKPIALGKSDYCKGNRFYTIEDLGSMPPLRVFGNSILSFFSKASSGYWEIMDPTNGYTAIHRSLLERVPLNKLNKRFFFESDMLFRLNICRAKVTDIPMKSYYGDEISNLSIRRAIPTFLKNHASRFFKRIFYTYFLRDFNAGSFLLISSLLTTLSGLIYGFINWYNHASQMQSTPTGTIVITAIIILTGVNLFISFINYDITQKPSEAIHPLL